MGVKKIRRIPIFLGAFLLVIFAKPYLIGIVVGFILIALGEGIRIWAAGHLQKNEVLTVTGPLCLCEESSLYWFDPDHDRLLYFCGQYLSSGCCHLCVLFSLYPL